MGASDELGSTQPAPPTGGNGPAALPPPSTIGRESKDSCRWCFCVPSARVPTPSRASRWSRQNRSPSPQQARSTAKIDEARAGAGPRHRRIDGRRALSRRPPGHTPRGASLRTAQRWEEAGWQTERCEGWGWVASWPTRPSPPARTATGSSRRSPQDHNTRSEPVTCTPTRLRLCWTSEDPLPEPSAD